MQLEFWKIGNTIFWSLNAVILLTIILDILILSKDWLDFVLLKLFLLTVFYFIYKLFKQKYGTPILLIHLILFSFNFLAITSISYTSTGNRLLYTTLLIALFVGFNAVAIWSIINSFIQYALVIITFSVLWYVGIIVDPFKVLNEGGYVFLTLGFISLFFPKTRKSILIERIRTQLSADVKISFLSDELSETNTNYKLLKQKVLKKENEYKFLFQQVSTDLNKIDETLLEIKSDASEKEKIKIDNLGALLQNLRNQSSIYFKPINLNPAKQNFLVDFVDIKKVYENTYKSFKTQISQKNLQFTEKITDSHRLITANERMLNTVVYNILNFVVIFSEENDKIEVKLDNIKDTVSFSILNKTYGLNTSEIESYFRDVEFVNYDYRKHSDSVKIGLRISKQLTEKMNGYFSYVSSKNMGYELKIQFNTNKIN
ncbi:ATP-binding protein [Wenyingzhuangia sp. IMCC45467]